MKYARLIPLAAFAFAACSDPATSPNARVLSTDPHFSPGTGAHFLSLSASFSGADLVISFREGGLGNSPTPGTVSIAVIGAATATYACVNGGGNHPKAANKENVSGPVGATGDFAIGKNGSASGTLTLSPPPSTLDCPSGQRFVLADVTYTGVAISDNTNGVLAVAVDGGGPFTKVFVVLN